MVLLDEAKFPVVDKAPSFWKTVGNFSFNDYATWAVVTGLCTPVGYVAGMRTPLMARPSMVTAATLGATCGFMLAFQNSAGRLLGLKPNDKEVNKYLQKS